MPRYAAFLRGLMPMNSNMADLRKRFEEAGYTDVRTVLASGNVVFTARSAPSEQAVAKTAGFAAFVRSIDGLRALVERDPFARHHLPPHTKRVVSFLRENHSAATLPGEVDGARILGIHGAEAFTAYVPGRGPIFMTLIEKTFGEEVTTRTWDTLQKVIRAGSEAAPAPKKRAARAKAARRSPAAGARRAGGRRRG